MIAALPSVCRMPFSFLAVKLTDIVPVLTGILDVYKFIHFQFPRFSLCFYSYILNPQKHNYYYLCDIFQKYAHRHIFWLDFESFFWGACRKACLFFKSIQMSTGSFYPFSQRSRSHAQSQSRSHPPTHPFLISAIVSSARNILVSSI